MKKYLIICLLIFLVSCQTKTPVVENMNESNEKNSVEEVSESNDEISVEEVSEVESTNESIEETVVEVKTDQVAIISSGLLKNVYAEMDENSEVIFTLNEYSSKDIVEKALVGGTTWYKFMYYGQEAFMTDDHVELVDAKSYQHDGVFYKIDVPVLNVRESYSTKSEILDQVFEGDYYRVLDEKYDDDNQLWFFIESSFGLKGWIASWFTVEVESPYKNLSMLSRFDKGAIDLVYQIYINDLHYGDDFSFLLPNAVSDRVENYPVTKRYNFNQTEYISFILESINVTSDSGSYWLKDYDTLKLDVLDEEGEELIIISGNELLIFGEKGRLLANWYYKESYDSIHYFSDEKLLQISGERDSRLFSTLDGIKQVEDFALGRKVEDGLKLDFEGNQLFIRDDLFDLEFSTKIPERLLSLKKEFSDMSQYIKKSSGLVFMDGNYYIRTSIAIPISHPIYFITKDPTETDTSRFMTLANLYYLVDKNDHTWSYSHAWFKHASDQSEMMDMDEMIVYKEGQALFKLGDDPDKLYNFFEMDQANGNEDRAHILEKDGLTYAFMYTMYMFNHISITSDEYTTYKGIRVGMSKDELLGILGQADEEKDNALLYYNGHSRFDSYRLQAGLLGFSYFKVILEGDIVKEVIIRSEYTGD